MSALDPASPVPKYHQIASALRKRIESGDLPPGTVLEPVRQAAERLGVNLHTVRHAYAELARDGLLESRRAVGTLVLSRPGRAAAEPPVRAEVGALLSELVERGRQELGLSLGELRAALDAWQPAESQGRSAVHVVECSRTQCEDLAGQISSAWDVDAVPWSLEQEGEPPAGPIVATYFHYNQIRKRWPHRLGAVRFATIRPEESLAERLAALAGESSEPVPIDLVELDVPTLEAVAADLSVVLPSDRFALRGRVVARAASALSGQRGRAVLLSPRVWGALGERDRADPRAIHVRYVFDSGELESIAAALSWTGRAAARRSR